MEIVDNTCYNARQEKNGEAMRIIVDADACPVKELIEKQARPYRIKVIMVANYSHQISSGYAETVMVDRDSQAADIYIANLTEAGDLIVTQDYGLASIVLGKGAKAIHPSGRLYTAENIDTLLMQRYLNTKSRLAGEKQINPKKRNTNDDRRFEHNLALIIKSAVDQHNK